MSNLTALGRYQALADARGQTLAQLALAWVLRHDAMSSILVAASKLAQLDDALGALKAAPFNTAELAAIDASLALA